MLFAHMPVTLLMLPAMFGDKVDYSTFMLSPFNSQLSTAYSAWMSLYVVAILVWYLYWSYVAFRRVTQFKDWRGVIVFGVITTISYLFSEYALGALAKM